MKRRQILGSPDSLTRSAAVAALFCTGLLLAGCGQKGPLYLPAPQGQPIKPAAPVSADVIEETTQQGQ
ncbi:LPS translocon maturation chaperone LptM [Hydrogenophaga electricum]|uniref:Lipoprotein n=1 Tax=Hydrogenophaga electricum TaxID=1230953 RepID=A0ABQ6C7X1_9BURK|nr:lipoprotein [Hydrogenophaga electricum]GLS15728.1 hypothetical protein GCM10007935_31650 [Hydrogenophaga electricum]